MEYVYVVYYLNPNLPTPREILWNFGLAVFETLHDAELFVEVRSGLKAKPVVMPYRWQAGDYWIEKQEIVPANIKTAPQSRL